jgi:spore germination cell wall hydrolase CwlJ-like protein
MMKIEQYERQARRTKAISDISALLRLVLLAVLIICAIRLTIAAEGAFSKLAAESYSESSTLTSPPPAPSSANAALLGETKAQPFTPAEIDLMQRVVAAEARGESAAGQLAVCEVILNRSALWGMSVTQIMTARGQFARPYRGAISESVKTAVQMAIAGERVFDKPVTHFHETSITPYWAASKTFAGRIGGHKFYY